MINRANFIVRRHNRSNVACSCRAAASTRPSNSADASASLSLSRRIFATGSYTTDCNISLLGCALAGMYLLSPEAANAASEFTNQHHQHINAAISDVAENEEFWGNVLRYISYFFSVLLGTAYVAVKPIIGLLKKPATAVLVIIGAVLLFTFVSTTVQGMLGMDNNTDIYTATSIVTPATR